MMKKYLVILFIVQVIQIVKIFGQDINNKIIYYDSTWKETDKENASFYRVIKDYAKVQSTYHVIDYFISGVKQMEGQFNEPEAKSKQGRFVWYYENGKKKVESNFIRNKRLGEHKTWYEFRKPKLVGEYFVDKKNPNLNPEELKIISFWNEAGKQTVVNGNGDYYNHSDSDHASHKGKVKNGKKEGIWTGYSEKHCLTYEEFYEEGKLKKGKSVDDSGKKFKYKKAIIGSRPIGGINAFNQYLFNNLKYPIGALENGIEGEVYLEFNIQIDGTIEGVKVIRSLGHGFDEEALRVIRDAKKWLPGKYRGKKTEQRVILPIDFRVKK
ncbi:MAG: energy transducer TonB [Bacteroidota bacterium]